MWHATAAIADVDFTVAAALAGLGRELDDETAAVVQRAIDLRTDKYARALDELTIVKNERARVAAALSFVDPSAPSALDAANAARRFSQVAGRAYTLNRQAIASAYERAGVDMRLDMPSAPQTTGRRRWPGA